MKRKKKLRIYYKRIIVIFIILIIAVIGISLLNEYSYNKISAEPSEVYGIKVNTQYIETNTDARPGKLRKIKYLVIHETDNNSNGANAENHAKFLSVNNKTSTSWHYTVDSKEIYHHIPDNEVAHHAATEKGNLYGIGIELCVNADGDFEKTFDNASKLVAYLIKEYNLSIKSIKTHNDFSGKDCPHSILRDNRMNEFVDKVNEYAK